MLLFAIPSTPILVPQLFEQRQGHAALHEVQGGETTLSYL